MKKDVFLRTFTGSKSNITLENFENVKRIYVEIITGDEILTVIYKDDTPAATYDSSDCRQQDIFDTIYELPIALVDCFSRFEGSPYQCYEYIERLCMPSKD